MPHWSLNRPARSAQLMVRLAGEYGVSPERCTDKTNLPRQALSDPTYEIQGRQELAVLRNILAALPPDVPFALEAGLRYRSTTHGMWGFAVTSSPTLRDALQVGRRYFDLSFSFNRFDFEVRGRRAYLSYDDCDNPDDLRAALVERDLAALVALHRETGSVHVPVVALELRGRRPPYAATFEELFEVMPRFGAAENRLIVEAAVLESPQPLADEFAQRVCDEQCSAQLAHQRARGGISGRVRARLLREPRDFPSMQELAAELGMSTRTLRNQLGREAASYRELVGETRAMLADQLLSTTQLPVEEIADRLGYADPSSFISAFKRWKGVSPRSYRDEQAQ